jgi:hypothetical protein
MLLFTAYFILKSETDAAWGIADFVIVMTVVYKTDSLIHFWLRIVMLAASFITQGFKDSALINFVNSPTIRISGYVGLKGPHVDG